MEKPQNFVQKNGRTKVKRGRRMKKKLRKKDRKKRKKKRKLAQQVTNSIFLQNEVTN